MAIIRNRTQQQYTNVANSIFRNKELSLRDRGLLTTLLSLPDNWRFSVTGLAEILKKDGKHSISAGLASLEKQGYLVRRQVKSKDGKFCGYEWEIFEEPQMKVPITDFRETDNPITEKLSAENQPQSNTNKVITKELNTNRSSEEETYRNKWQYQSAVKQTSGKVAEIVFESPHMHVVGVPVATGYKRGLSKQVAKTKVFTTEVLTMLQEEMHKRVDEEMQQHEELFQNVELKEIERGRNTDWSKKYYIQQKQELHQELEQEIKILTDDKERLEEKFVKKVVDTEEKKVFLQYAFLENPKSMIGKVVSGAWKQFRNWWESQKQKNVEEKAKISLQERLKEAKKQVDKENVQRREGRGLKKQMAEHER